MQRIYGTAWETPEQLKTYVKLKEEAAKRDHRKIGQDLDLFSLQETAGVYVCASIALPLSLFLFL